jgi:hypothetical protein
MLSINGVADPVAAAAGASLNCSQPQKDCAVISSYIDLLPDLQLARNWIRHYFRARSTDRAAIIIIAFSITTPVAVEVQTKD